MNELFDELRIEAGIARLADDPWLAVIDKNGKVIDPLIGLEKFAELIIRESAKFLDTRQVGCRCYDDLQDDAGDDLMRAWKLDTDSKA